MPPSAHAAHSNAGVGIFASLSVCGGRPPPSRAIPATARHGLESRLPPFVAPGAILARPVIPRRILARASRAVSAAPDFVLRAIHARGRRTEFSWSRRSARTSFIFDQLAEFFKFQPRASCSHLRDQSAPVPVEKAAAQKIIVEPAPRRGQPDRASPAPFAPRVHLLCRECRVAFHFAFVFRERIHRVMQQIAAQSSRLAFESQCLVNDPGKSRRVPPVQPTLKIRIPAGKTNPLPQVPGAPRDFVDWRFRLAFLPVQQGSLQPAAQFFIRIHRENPLVTSGFRREILLFGIAGPCPCQKTRTVLVRDRFRPIRASRVDYNDLVDNSIERCQQTGEIALFIQRNYAGGDALGRVHGAQGLSPVSYTVKCGSSLRQEIHANHGRAYAKLAAILQHRRAYSFSVKERPVR